MSEREPYEPTPWQEHRGLLLDRVLEHHLRRKYEVEKRGPFTEYHWHGVENGWDRLVDETFLRGEQKIVESIVDDLVQTGPEGVNMAAAIVFDHTRRHAEYVQAWEQYEQSNDLDQ